MTWRTWHWHTCNRLATVRHEMCGGKLKTSLDKTKVDKKIKSKKEKKK